MENQQYVASLGIPKENQQKCLAVMDKYEDNHWWEPDIDPRKMAYYQMLEPIMLVKFSDFHEAIALLLGRSVWTHEFGIAHDKLVQEAERAWKYQVAVTSDAERHEREQESIQQLQDWAKAHGKPIINVQLPE